jgi:hypothetical protein
MNQMAMHSKAMRFTWILSFFLLIFIIDCKKKAPTSPDLDEVVKPAIWIDISGMSFTGFESGQNPSSQTIKVKNSGGATLNYTISGDVNWLSISPASGSSTGNINEHTVSVNISSLSASLSPYSGTITIADSNANNSPKQVKVNLNILPRDSISISCEPSSGPTGTLVTISVTVKGNLKEIKAFGLELTFSAAMLEYQSVSKGDLTQDWSSVDGNVISSGIVRVGGYAGGANPIPKWSMGSIVKVILKVTGSGCTDGQQSQISIQNCIDDIGGMIIESPSITFTYRK